MKTFIFRINLREIMKEYGNQTVKNENKNFRNLTRIKFRKMRIMINRR